MSDDSNSRTVMVLAKSGLARLSQDWHHHLANEAGRARCGALLNLREWQVRELPHVPGNMCARCARLLKPKATAPTRVRVPLSAAPSDEDREQGKQLGLPLD